MEAGRSSVYVDRGMVRGVPDRRSVSVDGLRLGPPLAPAEVIAARCGIIDGINFFLFFCVIHVFNWVWLEKYSIRHAEHSVITHLHIASVVSYKIVVLLLYSTIQ